MAVTAVYVGIDVAKDRLDLHGRPHGTAWQVTNDEAGITTLVCPAWSALRTRVNMSAMGSENILF